ncbi:MAG: hypothetical protein J6M62_09285 [Selenomonadaceae bacterium]|nr:hypothetical protein [Selenomonadaceae bacterium]
MAERLTWDEIVKKYPSRWIGLTDVEREAPNDPNVISAVVKYTDKSMNELLRMQFRDDNLYSVYTTPDDEPFVGMNLVARYANS